MHVAKIGTSPRRRAPVAGGPEVETLTTTDGIAVVHMEIPAGGGLPEHDHGPSQIVLVLLSGVVRVTYGGVEHTLEPGAVAHVGTGQRITVWNPGTEPAALMLVASPSDFVAQLAAWPVA